MKEKMSLQNQNEEIKNEDGSDEEESTPIEFANMDEDESEEENVAEESNNDMLLKTYQRRTRKKFKKLTCFSCCLLCLLLFFLYRWHFMPLCFDQYLIVITYQY
ncbi:hypothetical protein V8G54_024836 [Vigna mungo]|uniref:Transmembrane protein n=1 Tax=Vigna mungo TaxID=3915 RepID=A0AAQ3N7U7_VIGMU